MGVRLFFVTSILLVVSFSLKAQHADLYELAEIEFVGNKAISTVELETVILSEETPWWFFKFLNSFTGFGKEPVYFDSSNIPVDLDALKAYYNANGFFRPSFTYSYTVDTTDKEVILTYSISENNQSKIGKINYSGLENIPENIIYRIQAEKELDSTLFYRQTTVEQSIAHTADILLNRGYMFTNHDSTIILIDTVTDRSDLNIYMTIGDRYKISGVQVEKKGDGAPYVSEGLLREMTDIHQDEYYNREKIRNSQNRLARTGLFTSLVLDANKKDTSGTYVPLLLRGSIGTMNELLPGIAMNNEKGVFNLGVNATYTRKNFLGDARKLTLSAEILARDISNFSYGRFFSRKNYLVGGTAAIKLKLEQPYLLSKPILGALENYFIIQTQNRETEKIYGTKASFEFEMPAYTFINQFRPYYNLEFYEDKAINQTLADSTLFISEFNKYNNTSYIGIQLGAAKANSIFFPTSGYNVFVTYEVAVTNVKFDIELMNLSDSLSSLTLDYNLNETALFYRSEITSSAYFPLSLDKTAVFALKTRVGYAQTFKGGRFQIPSNRTFFSGGSNSVRGWRSEQLYPESNDSLSIYSLIDELKGGTFLLEGSFEYRKRFLENFGAVVFGDYGNTWNGYNEFRFDNVALAIGLGLRYYTKIAPFRIDFGFKFYNPEDKSFIWNRSFFKGLEFHFGIGEAF